MSLIRSNSGQSQILAAMVLGFIMVTIGMFSLDYARRTTVSQIVDATRSELRVALDSAVKRAAELYHNDSSCDPIVLNERLSRMNLDGTIAAAPATGRRQIQIEVNGTDYTVAFGPATQIPWTGAQPDPSLNYSIGVSQDALLEVWASAKGIKVHQMAALINTCSSPCASTSAAQTGYCLTAADQAIAYHSINDPADFPGDGQSIDNCNGLRRFGDLDNTDFSCANIDDPENTCCGDAGRLGGSIDIHDVVILKNHLRSGDRAGSCTDVLTTCADFNRDTLVNEVDLNILEKTLRGYLHNPMVTY